MVTVIEDRIGGGTIRTVPVLIRGNVRPLSARIGLEDSDIGVIVSGRYRGKPIVPRWDWVLIESLKSQGLLKSFDPTWLVYVMYENMYSVRRYTMHVASQYGITFEEGTRADLLHIQQLFIALNRLSLGLRTTNADALAEKFKQVSGEIIARIGTRRRIHRNQRIAEAAAQLSTVLDSLERVNSSAKAAVALGGRNQAHGRLIDINHIEEALTSRQRAGDLMIHTTELYFGGMHDFLAAFVPVQGSAAHSITDRAHAETVRCALELFIAEVKRYDIMPFRATARYLVCEFASALELLRRWKFDAAAVILSTGANSLLLRQARISLERIIAEAGELVEQGSAEAGERHRLCADIESVLEFLGRVDETGFKHPVVADASSHLRIACAFMVAGERRALRQAKQALKDAAALL